MDHMDTKYSLAVESHPTTVDPSLADLPLDERLDEYRGLATTLRALSNGASGQRKIVTERADTITPRKLRWLWPERVPLGKITVFAGLPGQGKSLATVDIAARLTTGSKYFDSENPLPATSEVLFVAGEDDPEDALVPRLMAAGADCSKIHRLKAVRVNEEYDTLRLDMDAGGIEKFLKRHPHVRLVVIDPSLSGLRRLLPVCRPLVR